MADLAKKIELLIKDKRPHSLLVDGEEFPWHILSDGVLLTSEMDGVPVAYVAILAEKIETRFVSGTIDSKPEPNAPDTPKLETVDELSLGDSFILTEDSAEPSDNVLAFKEVGTGTLPYLVRVSDGWMWTHTLPGTNELPLTGPSDWTWEYVRASWAGSHLWVAAVALEPVPDVH